MINYFCHARMVLSDIHVFRTAGFPLKACGNDILNKRLNVQLVFLDPFVLALRASRMVALFS
jgi:hypothetical protein